MLLGCIGFHKFPLFLKFNPNCADAFNREPVEQQHLSLTLRMCLSSCRNVLDTHTHTHRCPDLELGLPHWWFWLEHAVALWSKFTRLLQTLFYTRFACFIDWFPRWGKTMSHVLFSKVTRAQTHTQNPLRLESQLHQRWLADSSACFSAV